MRNIEIYNKSKKYLTENIDDGIYLPMSVTHLTSVRVYLRDSDLNLFSLIPTTFIAFSISRKMGSIEVYVHKQEKWAPFVPDFDEWYQDFKDLRDEYVQPDHMGATS